MEKDKLGGWAIGEKLYDWIREHLITGSKILELGSGTGSEVLAKHYDMHCVEHDKKWMNKSEHITYYYAPLVNNWYDPSFMKDIPDDYDLLLIDGPPGRVSDRSIMLNYLEEMHVIQTLYIVIDDTNRQAELSLALKLWTMLENKEHEIFSDKRKNFSVLL